MTTENDKLLEHANYLRGRLHEQQDANRLLLEEVKRWKGVAEREHKSWIHAHNALNLLHQDAQKVMAENGATALHQELRVARDQIGKLERMRDQRRKLTRTAVEELAKARQENRDLEEVVEELRKKVTELEGQLETTANTAQEIINQRDAQVERFRGWCQRWLKGEVGAMEVVATITTMLNCDYAIEATVLDRRRATERAELETLVRTSSEMLQAIVAAVREAGVDLVSTPVQQVKDLVRLYKGQQETLNEISDSAPE